MANEISISVKRTCISVISLHSDLQNLTMHVSFEFLGSLYIQITFTLIYNIYIVSIIQSIITFIQSYYTIVSIIQYVNISQYNTIYYNKVSIIPSVIIL